MRRRRCGTGKATVTISDDESTISWDVTYSGLTGAPGAGHIHIGAVDATGPGSIIPFATVTATGSSGSFAAADYATGEGLPADWAGVLQSIRAGDTYVHIHTEANGSGEIPRGQLAASSAPPTDTGAAATDQPQPGSSVPLALLVMVAAGALAVGLRRFATR